MHRTARGGRDLDANVVVAQNHGVVTRRGLFRCAVEAGPVSGFGIVGRARFELWRAGLRHQQDVAHVRGSRAAQMGVGEAQDGGVVGVVSRTVLPAFDPGVGTGLDHSERCRGRRVGVSGCRASDEGIHAVGPFQGGLAADSTDAERDGQQADL